MVNFKARLSARLMFIARWRYEWGEVASSRYFCGTVIVLRYGVEMLAFASMTGGGSSMAGGGSSMAGGDPSNAMGKEMRVLASIARKGRRRTALVYDCFIEILSFPGEYF